MDTLPPELIHLIIRESIQGCSLRAAELICCRLALVHPFWRDEAQRLLYTVVELDRAAIPFLEAPRHFPHLAQWTTSLALLHVVWTPTTGHVAEFANLVQLKVRFSSWQSNLHFGLDDLPKLERLDVRTPIASGTLSAYWFRTLADLPRLKQLQLEGFQSAEHTIGNWQLDDPPLLKLDSLSLRNMFAAAGLPFDVAPTLRRLAIATVFPDSTAIKIITSSAPSLCLLSISAPPLHMPGTPDSALSPLVATLLRSPPAFPLLKSFTLRSYAIDLPSLVSLTAPSLRILQLLEGKIPFARADLVALVRRDQFPMLGTVALGTPASFVVAGVEFMLVCKGRGIGHRIDRAEERVVEWVEHEQLR